MQLDIWWLVTIGVAVTITAAGYQAGRWRQRAIHTREQVRRRLFSPSAKGSSVLDIRYIGAAHRRGGEFSIARRNDGFRKR